MGLFSKPKLPAPKPPTILAAQPFNPTAAQAARPTATTQGSADSNFGRATGTQSLINRLAPVAEERRKRTLLGG